ncbi:MAG: BCD family MFS transporter [Ardenticatenaceae bacterium]|nr:BCD family MFS transporter [Ardenticatenaceae bacterium]
MSNPLPKQITFSLGQTLRLSSFHVGSAMGDILATSVWNRVLISDLGLPAGPVGLLIALRYLLFPISLWAGYRSDTQSLFGYYRTPYVWIGRFLMVLSFPLLALSLTMLGENTASVAGWLVAFVCFLLYGIGTLFSGSPFLALVRDSVPPQKQGVAISMVQTALITLFPVAAIGFGRWAQDYNAAVLWQMSLTTMLVGGFFWFFAIVGVEKRTRRLGGGPQPGDTITRPDFGPVMRQIWLDQRTRLFFIFLSLSTFAAWMQDNILEPFGGDVFDLPISQTTRFTGYWGGATVLVLVPAFYFWRRRPPERQSGVTFWGLLLMAVGIALTGAAGLVQRVTLINPALLLFGVGFGFYTFGGFSLMAVMSPDRNAGTYLGLWTISVVIFKGLGTFFGGLLRDLLLGLHLPLNAAYGLSFIAAALGLVISAVLLLRLDVVGFARDAGRVATATDAQMALAD